VTDVNGFIVIVFFPAFAALLACGVFALFTWGARTILTMFGQDE
jgi:hypothetical protein